MLRPGVDASASRCLTYFAHGGVTVHDDRRCAPEDQPRLLAARLLERTLVRLGRAGLLIERRLAPGLSRMHGRRLYRPLGYVRLADYLTERLGMSLRRCQAILRLERALAGLPRMAQALEAGEISVSKLEVAAGAATAETETTWLERARRLPLASLREAAREASSSPAPAAAFPPTLPIEEDEPGRIISFTAPAPAVGIWHWTLDLVRRVAGQQEPAWRCAEFLAAEFLSGFPDATAPPTDPLGSARAAPALSEARPARVCDSPDGDTPGMSAWIEACAAVREALASIGAPADPEAILSGFPAAADPAAPDVAAAHPDDDVNPWDLDARLRRLLRLRQSLAWRQGRLLATFASLRLHRDLGFGTFDDWASERLAMSPRRARYLVSLDRCLRDRPLLADAYRRGLVSWCQVRLLVRVVRPSTQSRWIRYARQVTVRRLEDVIVEIDAGPGLPAHIGASPSTRTGAWPVNDPLPPDGPRPPDAAAPSRHEARVHTSAPLFDHTTPEIASLDRRTWRRISFWCPLDVASVWDSALRSCRAAAGKRLEDWECFLLFVRALRDTWENQEDPHWRRRYSVLERDGWRCKAPGCTSRSGLNAHHITFRSQQGGDVAGNLVTLCVGHHQQGLHEGRIRCFGEAPDALWWDLGVRPAGESLSRFFGDRLVRRRPFVPVESPPRVGPVIAGAR